MTAFSAAMAAIFRDPNMAVDAVFTEKDGGVPVPLRVVRRTPDEVASFGNSRMVAETLLIDVQLADAPTVCIGDTFVIEAKLWVVSAAPRRDRDRLLWRVELVAG